MTNPLNRRVFLQGTAAATFAAGFAPMIARAQGEPLGIALVVPSPFGDVGWSYALSAGLDAVKAEYGDAVKLTLIESIAEGPDADRIMNKAVADGHKFLIAGSFGYQNGTMQIARRNPDVSVLHASGFMTAPNFTPFAARYYQGTYLMGMAAAALSKTGKLGSVSAFPIPELITSVNAFALGARAVNPDAEVSVVWVNSWFDPAKEQEAARALLAQNCDVVFSNAQDTPSVVSVCEEAGAYVFNLNSSMKKYAPEKYLGCVATDWSPFFLENVKAHIDGNFEGHVAFLGMADGVVKQLDWSEDIPAEIKDQIAARETEIMAGDFAVFSGPIARQDDSEGVADGAAMTDEEIVAMDWHVKGVTTPLPN